MFTKNLSLQNDKPPQLSSQSNSTQTCHYQDLDYNYEYKINTLKFTKQFIDYNKQEDLQWMFCYWSLLLDTMTNIKENQQLYSKKDMVQSTKSKALTAR